MGIKTIQQIAKDDEQTVKVAYAAGSFTINEKKTYCKVPTVSIEFDPTDPNAPYNACVNSLLYITIPAIKAIDPMPGKPGEYEVGPLSQGKHESDIYRAVASKHQEDQFSTTDKIELTTPALQAAIRQAAAAYHQFQQQDRPVGYTLIVPDNSNEKARVGVLLKAVEADAADIATIKVALVESFKNPSFTKRHANAGDCFMSFLLNELQRFDLTALVGPAKGNMLNPGSNLGPLYGENRVCALAKETDQSKVRADFIQAIKASEPAPVNGMYNAITSQTHAVAQSNKATVDHGLSSQLPAQPSPSGNNL